MSIGSVMQIVQLLIPAIQTAENFIRGNKRGAEKKEAVLAELGRRISDIRRELGETTGIDLKAFNWIKFALNAPQFLEKVGKVVDAIVELANYIQEFEEVEEAATAVPSEGPVN